jgi:uncharacterized membrane protein
MSVVVAYHVFLCVRFFLVQGVMWTSVKLKMRERKLRNGAGKGLKATRRKRNGRISKPWSIRIKQWQ